MNWNPSMMRVLVFNPDVHECKTFHGIWTPWPPGPDFTLSSENTSVKIAVSCFRHSNSIAAERIQQDNEIEWHMRGGFREESTRLAIQASREVDAVTFDLIYP